MSSNSLFTTERYGRENVLQRCLVHVPKEEEEDGVSGDGDDDGKVWVVYV